MKYAKIKELLQAFTSILQSLLTVSYLGAFPRILQSLLTVSYLGAYRYYTLEPIEKIEKETSRGELMKELIHFRQIKNQELSFVTKAEILLPSSYKATLSAAAVIGVFSWPTTNTTVWAAKMLWNWSFFMSTFSLIGSAHIQLLEHLPNKDEADYDDKKISMILNLFLQPSAKQDNLNDTPKQRRISKRMLWVWQNPLMLMSYSWIFFIVGYALHVLTPIFDPSQAEISFKMAILTICGCVLLGLNFAFCAGMCQYRLYGKSLLDWIKHFFRDN